MAESFKVHQRLPKEECYFAVLDGSRLPFSPFSRVSALGYLFEALLPLSLTEMHAVYLPLANRRYLACGAERNRLEAALRDGARTLTPAACPPVFEQAIDLTALNLLVREFEPPAVTNVRKRRRRTVFAVSAAVVALFLIGLERRRHFDEARVARLLEQQEMLLDRTFGPAEPGVAAAQRRARLLSELRVLRRTRTTKADGEGRGVPATLGRLLDRWPKEEPLWIESLNVSPAVITIRGKAATATVAQSLTDQTKTLAGWSVDQPQFAQSDAGVHFTVRLQSTHANSRATRPGGRP